MIIVWIKQILRRVFNVHTLKDTVLFAVCLFAIRVQKGIRVPGETLSILIPWLGFVLTVVSFLYLVVQLLAAAPSKAPLRRDLRVVQQITSVLLFGFIAYSAYLLVNGVADALPPVAHKSVVLDMTEGELYFGGFVPYARANLQSWRDPSKVERVLLSWREQRDLWVKEPVLVQVNEGALGLPWISAIEADEEVRMQQVLKIAPTAAAAWKNLVWFYLNDQRWDDAVKTALEYFKHYPDDTETAVGWSDTLFMYRQIRPSLAILEPLLARRPNFKLYLKAAWTLGQYHQIEDKERALQLTLAAVKMEPDNPVSYYHLGHIYYWMNRPQEALTTFERMLTMWRAPEVEKIVEQLRNQTTTNK